MYKIKHVYISSNAKTHPVILYILKRIDILPLEMSGIYNRLLCVQRRGQFYRPNI